MASTSIVALPDEVEAVKGPLIYQNEFSSGSALDDFLAEGPASAAIVEGRLRLESSGPSGPSKGNFVYWLRAVSLPGSYTVELEFTPLEKAGFGNNLNIVFLSAKGVNGADIFDPSLRPRNGDYRQYHSGDIDNYGLRFYNGGSPKYYLRRNVGHALVAEPSSNPLRETGRTYRFVIVKSGPDLSFSVDSVTTLRWTDPDPLVGGRLGFRHMAGARSTYDNLRIWRLGPGCSSRTE